MSYKRADELLPQDVLEILQKYVSGETIYVPKSDDTRQKWGANTGTRENLQRRNEQILSEYRAGIRTKELAQKYFLTEKSVQRILRTLQSKPPMKKE